ncbi:MAG TPA: isochorismatase family cysteine hydrolase [Syntrophorhabdaceae bacterium]|nr:isochorismatase family cysteine hydrolase [Syntrophorhabdaceae bacterium]
MEIELRSSALILIDIQVGIVGMLPHSEQVKVLANLGRAISAARNAHVPVMHVTVGYRPGYPEVSARNTLVSRTKNAGRLLEKNPDAKICPEIEVRSEDIVVTKRRTSAFFGTDLEIILRTAEIDTLILAGVSTLVSVESTVRDAFDRDFRLIVLGDCCSDADVGAHEVALITILPRASTVCTTDELIAALQKGSRM